jgi:hypothetical protein
MSTASQKELEKNTFTCGVNGYTEYIYIFFALGFVSCPIQHPFVVDGGTDPLSR